MSEALYVIGNGFDLYHGMSTSYADFCQFVKNTDSNLHYRIERYLLLFENWSNLEESLGAIDIDQIMDDAGQFLMSYGDENWSDSGHGDYEYEIKQSVAALSSQLADKLQKWISKVEVPEIGQFRGSYLFFEPNRKFLNFNYTQTLQILYGICSESVLHVHGDVSSPILGHSWNPEEITPESLSYTDENMDVRVIGGNEILKSIFEDTFKPTDDIIQENLCWFQELTSTKSIYIFGHSLSEIDRSYFYEICRHINSRNVVWHISYHHDSELLSHQEFMNQLGIAPDLVEYNRLSSYATQRT